MLTCCCRCPQPGASCCHLTTCPIAPCIHPCWDCPDFLPLQPSTSRYCAHLLAGYLITAASPLSTRSRQLLGFTGLLPVRTAATTQPAAGPGGVALPSAEADLQQRQQQQRREEEEVLAAEPLSAPTAAALRQGAYALYGACFASEVRWHPADEFALARTCACSSLPAWTYAMPCCLPPTPASACALTAPLTHPSHLQPPTPVAGPVPLCLPGPAGRRALARGPIPAQVGL